MSLNNQSNISFLNGSLRETLAAIFSVEGLTLSERERNLFAQANPFGFILFARNCDNPQQLRALTDELRAVVGRDCPILIDQEGGRVQRLKPPHWRSYPNFQSYGDMVRKSENEALEALRFDSLRIAEELREMGINVDCTPVVDVLAPETHDVIGDRAFSNDASMVSRLGLSVCRNFLSAGVTPIIKHIPGHGRAKADSHLELPRVDASAEDLYNVDFKPFKEIAASDVGDAVWAMTAHIVYEALDAEHVASASPHMIKQVIRKDIGFDGILMSDDLDMKALDCYGDVARKAALCLEAGCDLALYCAGEFDSMEKLAESVPKLREDTLIRLQNAANLPKVAA